MLRSCFILLISSVLLSCTSSYTRESVNKKYLKYTKSFHELVDDEIQEKKRAKLEKNFKDFSKNLKEFKNKNSTLDTSYLDEYIKDIDIKVQYLEDLKD